MECGPKIRILTLKYIELPNRTLPARWYNGNIRIYELNLDHVSIAIIEADAFDSPAFQKLKALRITNRIQIVDYRLGMLNSLPTLAAISLHQFNACHQTMPAHILEPVRQTLRVFSYGGDIGPEPILTNLFGNAPWWALSNIGIDGHRYLRNRLIAEANFTGLRAIAFLCLTQFGIEIIEPGAFNGIIDTLQHLVLMGNPLLELSVHSFRSFLDAWPSVKFKFKELAFSHPQYKGVFNCSLEFYRVRNASAISFPHVSKRLAHMFCRNDVHDMDEETRDLLQIVHSQRWHLNHSSFRKYAFPKRRLIYVVANRSMHVKQAMPDEYRLFMWSLNRSTLTQKSKCPSADWIISNVECQLRNHSIESMRIPEFVREDLVAACVIHISMRKQSLPMHCITIHIDETDDFSYNCMHYGLGAMIGISIMTIVSILIIHRRRALSVIIFCRWS